MPGWRAGMGRWSGEWECEQLMCGKEGLVPSTSARFKTMISLPIYTVCRSSTAR